MNRDRQIDQLRGLVKKRDSLIARLNKYKHILRATIIERGNICGKVNCRCKRKDNPLLHGPYKYLSHRGRRTQMIFLNKIKLRYADRGIKEYQKLIGIIYQISEINFQILRYYYHRLEDYEF